MHSATRQGHLFENSFDGPNDGFHPAPTPARMEAIARPRLAAMLEKARMAEQMPWEPPEARAMDLVFHNMANWLPEPEREALREAFLAEMRRLRTSRDIKPPSGSISHHI